MTLLSFLRSATGAKTSSTSGAAQVEEYFDLQAKSKAHLSSPRITDDASTNEVESSISVIDSSLDMISSLIVSALACVVLVLLCHCCTWVVLLLQILRRQYKPVLPSVFTASAGEPNLVLSPCSETALINKQDRENNVPHAPSEETKKILASLFPNTINSSFNVLQAAPAGTPASTKALRVGAVLSGGQAAGGHNVICGLFDYVKRVSKDSRVYGFLGGPHGLYSHEYKELTGDIIDQYRNSGGFDMIRSGRHKVETEEQKEKSLEICNTLQLDGLVIIGGDDSNTNAAVLAEYFKAKGSPVSVIGCPKTIDGDLKNCFVEISFGFDTACKTYSQLIGCLMADAKTGGHAYHFVRLMGRSASLITLECAVQTHPNLALIGEEVQAKNQSLKHLVATIADLVEGRHNKGKNYGIILLPEGLIEFIPEVGVLIQEINNVVANGPFAEEKLTPESRRVFEALPESTQQQLLLERDPHGNVQVAMIHTEKLLALMTETELKKRQFRGGFHATCHYLGYEGRSGYPSTFDATYCYALGHVAAALMQHKATACMAVLKNMSSGGSPADWKPAGIPLTSMMTLETRKGKANVPVIKKFLVDIDRPLFKVFAQVREEWKLNDFYQIPGPMQLHASSPHHKNAVRLHLPFTLIGAPPAAALLSTISSDFSLSRLRQNEEIVVPAALKQKDISLSFSTLAGGSEDSGVASCPAGANHFLSYVEKLKEVFPLLTEECCRFAAPLALPCTHTTTATPPTTTTTSVSPPPPSSPSADDEKEKKKQLHLFVKGNNMTLQPIKTEQPYTSRLRAAVVSSTSTTLLHSADKVKVGVVLIGRQVPGVANVLLGVVERTTILGGKVYGFKGAAGLIKNEFHIISEKDALMHKNAPAFDLLGRTENEEASLCTAEGMRAAAETVRDAGLDFLLVIGWTLLHAATLSELLAKEKLHARVISVAAESDFSHFLPGGALSILRHLTGKHIAIGNKQQTGACCCPKLATELLQLCGCRRLGFDTQTKVASEMIGNLETDSNSAAKYYYFCAVAGGWEAECEVAIQTHPNIVVSSQKYKNQPLKDVVKFVVEAVKQRAEAKKNFGVIIINQDFFLLHRELRLLALEIHAHLHGHQQQQTGEGEGHTEKAEAEEIQQHLSPEAKEVYTLLPTAFQKKLVACIARHPFPRGLHKFPVHELLTQWVTDELKEEKKQGRYSGTFSPVCFEFSSSLSASFPSYYDSSMGLMLGQLAVLAGVSPALPSHAVHVSIRNPSAAPTHWEPQVRPTAVLAAQAHCLHVSTDAKAEAATTATEEAKGAATAAAISEELYCLADGCVGNMPSVLQQLIEKGMMQPQQQQDNTQQQQQQERQGGAWMMEEKYCNPGPLQFGSPAKDYCNTRALYEATAA